MGKESESRIRKINGPGTGGPAFFRLRNQREGTKIKKVVIKASDEDPPALPPPPVFMEHLDLPAGAEDMLYEVQIPHARITMIEVQVQFTDAMDQWHEVTSVHAPLRIRGGISTGYVHLLDDEPDGPLKCAVVWPEVFPQFVCPPDCG